MVPRDSSSSSDFLEVGDGGNSDQVSLLSEYEEAIRRLLDPQTHPEATVSVTQVVPGRGGLTVGFTVHHDNEPERLYFVEPSSSRSSRQGLVPISLTSGLSVVVWQYPADPGLPALPSVVYPEACSVLLSRMGKSGHLSELSLMGYRPGRRAVVKAIVGDETVFIKVVRPEKTEEIVKRYRSAIEAECPIPRVLDWSGAGIIVLEEASGIVLTEAMSAGVDPQTLAERVIEAGHMMSALPSVGEARRPAVESWEWYFRQADTLFPAFRDSLDRLKKAVQLAVEEGNPGPSVQIHGDLHPGQIFVDPSPPHRVRAIIDLDGAGTGFWVDDVAAFVAHSLTTSILDGLDETAKTFWADVAAAIPQFASLGVDEKPRFVAGVVTHLVGHALNTLNFPIGHAEALLDVALDLVDEFPGNSQAKPSSPEGPLPSLKKTETKR